MARNNISLSISPTNPPRGYEGPWKIRWREDVVEDGQRVSKARSKSVSDKGARDALVAKIRRTLESGDVYAPEARVVTTAANLELAALAWLRWQSSRDRKKSTRTRYKSAIARIMGTIRRVRGIKADATIPVTVLDVQLFTEMRNRWIAEDAAAGSGANGKRQPGQCSPLWRYHLSGHLFSIWSYCASQPATYPCIPALVDRGLVIPPVPPRSGAPEAPTWTECDAVVRRAYGHSADLGDVLAGERLTGLRVVQIVSIRRRALDPVRCTLQVEMGKSAAEDAEKRTVPVPRSLVELWQARIAAGPDAYLFATESTASGHYEVDSNIVTRLWTEAEEAGEVRANAGRRRVPLPTRARSVVSAPDRGRRGDGPLGRGDEGGRGASRRLVTAQPEEEAPEPCLPRGLPGPSAREGRCREVRFELVGHEPKSVEGLHYSAPTMQDLRSAIDSLEDVNWTAPLAAAPRLALVEGGR